MYQIDSIIITVDFLVQNIRGWELCLISDFVFAALISLQVKAANDCFIRR